MRGGLTTDTILYGRTTPRSKYDSNFNFIDGRENKIAVHPVDRFSDLFLVESSDDKNFVPALITQEDKEELENALDPTELWEEGEISLYRELNAEGKRVLQDTVFEEVQKSGIDFISAEESLRKDSLEKDDLVIFRAVDNTFWPPDRVAPLSRPEKVILKSDEFYLERSQQILSANQAVLHTELNAGQETLKAIIKLPQDTYETIWTIQSKTALPAVNNLQSFIKSSAVSSPAPKQVFHHQLDRHDLLDLFALSTASKMTG